MSKLQDIISEAVFNGGMYEGALPVTTAVVGNANLGIYNPAGSGITVLITELTWSHGYTQPLTGAILSFIRNLNGTPVTAPTTLTFTFRQKFGSSPISSNLSPVGSINYNGYNPNTSSQSAFNLAATKGTLPSFQPNVIYRLSDYVDLTNSQPLLLYPGDIMVGTAFDLTFGGVNNNYTTNITFVQV